MHSFGPYRLLGELARGGLGVVYRAFDPRAGREVALKVLARGFMATPAQRERFLREARVQQAFDHPNLVRVHEAGEVQGVLFLALELLPGGTLEERLRAQGPLEPTAAAELVAKLARGLSHAHAQGVLHRDLKPLNVLFTSGGEPCLSDFGLASAPAEGPRLSYTGMLLGTPGYAPPEQVGGELRRVGPRSDVYGLGALLYACLTGRAPCEGTNLADLLLATTDRPPTPPSLLRPEVPRELEAICLRCLAKQPEERFESAAAVAGELTRFLRAAPTDSEETGPVARRRRRRRALEWGALALAAASCAAALALLLVRPPPAAPAPVAVAPAASSASSAPAEVSPAPPTRVGTAPEDDPDLQRVVALIAANSLREALSECDRLLALQGERAQLRGLKSIALRHLNDLAAAEAEADRALALDPDEVTALTSRAALRLGRRDHAGAAEDYRRASALHPERAELHALLARAVAPIDEDAARQACEEALARDPEQADALAVRGTLRAARRDQVGARADLERAVGSDPTSTFAWTQLTKVLYTLRDGAAMRAAAERLIELAPQEPQGYDLRGRARARMGDLPGGIADLSRALEIDPARVETLIQRSKLRTDVGELDGARSDLDRVIELTPDDPEAWERRGMVRFHQRDLPGALEDYARAAERSREPSGSLLFNRASARRDSGDLEGALADYTRSLEKEPRNPSGWFHSARITRLLGRLDEAQAHIQRALELSPQASDLWLERAAVHVERQEHAAAVEVLDQLLSVPSVADSPLQPEALAWRGRARLGLGQRAEGEADLRAALAEAPPDGELAQRVRGWLEASGE